MPYFAGFGTKLQRSGSGRGLALATFIALVIVGWLAAVLLTDSFQFVVLTPRGSTGFEMFLALGQFFGALVLALSSLTPTRQSTRWVAMALFVLGFGALEFGYFFPLFVPEAGANVSLYGSLVTRGVAALLLAIGLLPADAPNLGRLAFVSLLATATITTVVLIFFGDQLPALVNTPNWENLLTSRHVRVFPGLSPWYFVLSLFPLLLSLAAAWGAIRYRREHRLRAWLIVGAVLFAGAQLHALLWPSMYSSILTTTSVLRFGWAIVVIAGSIVELYGLSRERSILLAQEQERVRQLEGLNLLKRDFTSMVAHELGTPLAAIGNLAQMITSGVLPEDRQRDAAGRIQSEARLLQLLVRDVQESADIERDDFSVRPQRVWLQNLLDDAYGYANTLGRGHPCSLEVATEGHVLADPDRIGQVIRNLVNNAARHTPAGTPIQIEAVREGTGVRIAVVDRGPGIDPDEHGRILEKFGRGTNAGRDGRRLGLYLTQRILEAHGSCLVIESEPGHGSRFSFRLEEAP